MTKLMEWLSVAGAALSIWLPLVLGFVKSPLIDEWMTAIILSPLIFIILFGLYAVTVVLYRVFTFNDCEMAAEELKKEIIEARSDLTKMGFKF